MQSLPGSVTLEILRHGPPHNQLLSPLTQYLALCGNYGATTVNVPYEHAQFRARLRPLMYDESEPLRQLQLQETSADMGRIFEKVPGLIAALSEAGGRELGLRWHQPTLESTHDPDLMSQQCVHLDLVLSASELALLPFELAQAPEGCPGSGRPLLLQSQMPICLTRRVRHNNHPVISWNRPPRILLAAASPTGKVPLQQHINAVVLALQPWIDRSAKPGDNLEDLYSEFLTILPQASWSQIEGTLAAACDENPARPYTHVHLLAHGVSIKEAGSRWYGVQLHDSLDPTKPDDVTAQQLALALRPAGKEGRGGFSIPTVVTLATCYGAGQSSVVGAGASVAHTLHEAGIPLVIASQFPLTFAGSVVMAELLYRGFLRGHDPRVLITRLRRELRGAVKDSHDWASIVAYASFDGNMETQLREFRYQQSKRSADRALTRYFREAESSKPHFKPVIAWLGSALDRLQTCALEHKGVPGHEGYNVHGQIAATLKKLSYIRFLDATEEMDGSRSNLADDFERANKLFLPRIVADLRQSAKQYELASVFDPMANWSRVQKLVLDTVLCGVSKSEATDQRNRTLVGADYTYLSTISIEQIRAARDRIELEFLRLIFENPSGRAIPFQQPLRDLVDDFIRLAGPRYEEVDSLREQLSRYHTLFCVVAIHQIRKLSQPNRSPVPLETWVETSSLASAVLKHIDHPSPTMKATNKASPRRKTRKG